MIYWSKWQANSIKSMLGPRPKGFPCINYPTRVRGFKNAPVPVPVRFDPGRAPQGCGRAFLDGASKLCKQIANLFLGKKSKLYWTGPGRANAESCCKATAVETLKVGCEISGKLRHCRTAESSLKSGPIKWKFSVLGLLKIFFLSSI